MTTKSNYALWVWVCLAVSAAPISANPPQSQQPSSPAIRNLADNKFVALAGLPECYTAAVESGDPSKGSSVILVKGTPGCGVTWHWHTPNEHIMLVSGTASIQMKDDKAVVLRPGAFALMPSHHIHRFSCVLACAGYVYSDGIFDIHWVDATGKDIPADAALKISNPHRTSTQH